MARNANFTARRLKTQESASFYSLAPAVRLSSTKALNFGGETSSGSPSGREVLRQALRPSTAKAPKDHFKAGSGLCMLSPEAKRAPLRQLQNMPSESTLKFGKENLGRDMKPKTPAKAKAMKAVHGKEIPVHHTNGHMMGEEHLWSEGLVVSPTHTHDMMENR